MKYAIESVCGQWWTGTCWGVKEAREVYTTTTTLPLELPDSNDRRHMIAEYSIEPLDIRYDDIAAVREVR